VVDALHGVEIADPYRWLEHGASESTADWVHAQNEHTRQALDARPHRDRWLERLSALMSLPTVLSCSVRGDRLFVLERAASADQFALVVRSASDPTSPARTLLDPAALAADAAVAIDWFEPSDDGSLVAIGLSEGGTEDSVLHLLRVDTGAFDEMRIPNTRACSVAWLPDTTGFWYTRYPEHDQYHRHVRLHVLGTDPAVDPVVFDRLPTPETWAEVTSSPDGAHVLVELMVGWNRTDVHLLHVPSGEWQVLVEGVEAVTSLQFHGDGVVGRTSLGAPNGRMVAATLAAPTSADWRTVVPEMADAVLGGPALAGDDLIVSVSRSAIDTLERWSTDGERLHSIDGLGVIAVQGLAARRGHGEVDEVDEVFVTVSSFTEPPTVWKLAGDELTRWCPEPVTASDASGLPDLVVTHLGYPSLDGTEIGMFVVHRRGVTPSPDVPLVLNGYGGFAIAESPTWMPNLAAWCAAGGVWAIAQLRGGYEHGERWHDAGRRALKQNVFDDFHAAGDWLVANGKASHDKLAVVGGSNGGLLVGAAITQRPDLARAVWCAVPLLDMVRFPQFLIARLWTDEYGDPDVAEEFAWLHAYSPYHHVHQGATYPSALFTTAEGDTRVDPLHARKMAALLQHAAAGQHERPVLLWQVGRAGHGVGKPASMRVAEGVDVLSFLWWQLGCET